MTLIFFVFCVINIVVLYADMVELADTPDLGSGGKNRAGSSPVVRTSIYKWAVGMLLPSAFLEFIVDRSIKVSIFMQELFTWIIKKESYS